MVDVGIMGTVEEMVTVMKFCADKDLDKFVKGLMKEGWDAVRGGSHWIAIAPNGRKLPIPGSHGSHKNLIMWRAQARRLMGAC